MTITSSAPATRPVRVRRVAWHVLLWLLVLPGLAWVAIRLGGWERSALVQLFAFTPYVAAWSVVPVIAALATRRWLAAAVATITCALFAAAVLPRAFADGDRGPQAGVALRVMTSNMLFGNADPATIVRLVRDNDVAVLAVQEFSPNGQRSLAAAGLGELLPYSSLGAEFGASGSGLYSRYPITAPGVRRNDGGFNQAYGTVQPPGAVAVTVESAHPLAPYSLEVLGRLAGRSGGGAAHQHGRAAPDPARRLQRDAGPPAAARPDRRRLPGRRRRRGPGPDRHMGAVRR